MFKPLAKLGINTAYSYIEKDPEKNMGKLMDWVDKFAGDDEETNFHKQRAVVRDVIDHPESNWYRFVMRLFNETDNDVLKKIFTNFVLNAVLSGWKTQEAAREKYQCNIPWAILMDPTSACNLHCTGCWAAEYGNKLNLSFEDLDSIITQGKELGVYLYIYTGGEPLVRKKDLIALCNKHSDCVFLCFTNSTLIDEEFADDMLRVKNFVPAISLEGFEAANDSRRGDGVYQKVMHAMQILRDRKLPFGISTCYTSVNCNDITSEKFIDQVIGMGAKFAWFFHYMPVGQDAAPELLPTPEQRNLRKSAVTGAPSPCLPWTSRTTRNMWAAALQAVGAICISMQPAMWIPACSFTIPTRTFTMYPCWMHCAPRCLWLTMTISRLTRICCGLAPCWRIPRFCPNWWLQPEHIPRTRRLPKRQTHCAPAPPGMRQTGRRLQRNCGNRALAAPEIAPAAEHILTDTLPLSHHPGGTAPSVSPGIFAFLREVGGNKQPQTVNFSFPAREFYGMFANCSQLPGLISYNGERC